MNIDTASKSAGSPAPQHHILHDHKRALTCKDASSTGRQAAHHLGQSVHHQGRRRPQARHPTKLFGRVVDELAAVNLDLVPAEGPRRVEGPTAAAKGGVALHRDVAEAEGDVTVELKAATVHRVTVADRACGEVARRVGVEVHSAALAPSRPVGDDAPVHRDGTPPADKNSPALSAAP